MIKQPKTPKNSKIDTIHPDVVLLYTRLYNAFLGLVTHPHPLGALNPRFCRTYLFRDVLAAMRLLRFGMRNPNFIQKYYPELSNFQFACNWSDFSIFQKRFRWLLIWYSRNETIVYDALSLSFRELFFTMK